MADFTQMFLQGLQAGQAQKEAALRHQKEQEDRDLQRQMLKHQMDRLKIEDQVKARELATKFAEDRAKFEGPMGPSPDTAGRPGSPIPGPPAPDVQQESVPVNLPGIEAYGIPAETVMAPTAQGRQRTILDQFNQQRQMIEAAKEPRAIPQPTTASLALAAAKGDKEALAAMGLIKSSAGGGRGNEAVALTSEGEAMAALQFVKTGKLPPLGFDAKTKTKIINRAATLTPDEVQSLEQSGLDLAGNSMDYAADKGSLTTLQRTRDAVTAFEKTAIRNIDIFLGAAKNAVDTGSPLINQPVRAVAGTLLGSKNLAEFNAARQVALTEAAKVLNNPNLSGVLSDSARKEVESLLSPNATLGQAYAVFNLLKTEMKGRTQYLDQTIAEIKGRGKTGTTTKSGFTIVEVK